MLEWIAGSTAQSADNTGTYPSSQERCDDAPTTPAPVFAARAFKHFIWGTPDAIDVAHSTRQPRREHYPVQRRRNSNTQNVICEADKNAPSTPKVKIGNISPAKRPGILLTPGTGGIRRKTVSFERKPLDSDYAMGDPSKHAETPRIQPGGYTSPMRDELGNQELCRKERATASVVHMAIPQGSADGKQDASEDVTLDLKLPRSVSGRYWKSEFDSYSTRSTLEMKKLAKKEQVARKFAKHKDIEVAKLLEALRLEHARVLELEKQIANYAVQLKEATERNRNYSSDVKDLPDRPRTGSSHAVDTQLQTTFQTRMLSKSGTEVRLPQVSTQLNQIEQATVQSTGQTLGPEIISTPPKFESARQKMANKPSSHNLCAMAQTLPQSSNRPGVASHDLGSDIWTDAGCAKDAVSQTKTLSRWQAEENSLLKPKNINIAQQVAHEMPREDKLSSERREAAMKRLEERRRNRTKTNAG